jgi:hypothetical protein
VTQTGTKSSDSRIGWTMGLFVACLVVFLVMVVPLLGAAGSIGGQGGSGPSDRYVLMLFGIPSVLFCLGLIAIWWPRNRAVRLVAAMLCVAAGLVVGLSPVSARYSLLGVDLPTADCGSAFAPAHVTMETGDPTDDMRAQSACDDATSGQRGMSFALMGLGLALAVSTFWIRRPPRDEDERQARDPAASRDDLTYDEALAEYRSSAAEK